MKPRGAPKRIRAAHPAEQGPDLRVEPGPARPGAPALPAPVVLEPLAVPADGRFWLNDHERSLPVAPFGAEEESRKLDRGPSEPAVSRWPGRPRVAGAEPGSRGRAGAGSGRPLRLIGARLQEGGSSQREDTRDGSASHYLHGGLENDRHTIASMTVATSTRVPAMLGLPKRVFASIETPGKTSMAPNDSAACASSLLRSQASWRSDSVRMRANRQRGGVFRKPRSPLRRMTQTRRFSSGRIVKSASPESGFREIRGCT